MQQPVDTYASGNTTSLSTFHTLRLLPEHSVILFSTLNISVFLVGVFGNVLTLLLIAKSTTMRRSIHLYTFNLCISDLFILLFFVPTQVVSLNDDLRWTIGADMCRVSYVVIPTSLMTTIGTLLSISVDRARGLVKPFQWRASSRKTAKRLIPALWIFAVLVSSPLFFVVRLTDFGDGTMICAEEWPSQRAKFYYWLSCFVFSYAVPLFIIFVIQVLLVYTIKFKVQNRAFRKQNKRMANMTVAIVVVFALCTGMQHILFFLVHFSIEMTKGTFLALYCTSSFVIILQAASNPFIYGKFRGDFKRGYKKLLQDLLVWRTKRYMQATAGSSMMDNKSDAADM